MIVTNTTKTFTAKMVRRIVSFCCREIGVPVKIIKRVHFGVRSNGGPANGYASFREQKILIRVNEKYGRYPTAGSMDNGNRWPACADIWDAAIFVTGHEIQHIVEWVNKTHYAQVKARDLEPHCDRIGIKCLNAFNARRDELLAAWCPAPVTMAEPAPVTMAEPAPVTMAEPAPVLAAKSPLVSARAAKAAEDLARWERKLKIAKTKVAKYRNRVRYYARKNS